MKVFRSGYLWAGVLLLLLGQHLDYLYQSALFGWGAWLPLSADAPKWGLLDFIPHDSWHVVQTIRNHAIIIGASLVAWAYRQERTWWWILTLLLVYALTRAVGFTLFLPRG